MTAKQALRIAHDTAAAKLGFPPISDKRYTGTCIGNLRRLVELMEQELAA